MGRILCWLVHPTIQPQCGVSHRLPRTTYHALASEMIVKVDIELVFVGSMFLVGCLVTGAFLGTVVGCLVLWCIGAI